MLSRKTPASHAIDGGEEFELRVLVRLKTPTLPASLSKPIDQCPLTNDSRRDLENLSLLFLLNQSRAPQVFYATSSKPIAH